MSESKELQNDIDKVTPQEVSDVPEQDVQTSATPPRRKKSLGRRIARCVLWLVLTPILLLLLMVVLLYLPPVQKWAVDKACAMLSEEMDMEVSVESVYLTFPLDLKMGGMLAIQEGDTVLDAQSLDLSIQLLPLFSGQIEVDGIQLENTKLNTREIVDAALVKGSIGHVSLDSHGIDLHASTMRFNHINLRDADLYVALADSVPEDTTSEPSLWLIQLDDVLVERVKMQVLLAPQADSTLVGTYLERAQLEGILDLASERYLFKDINIEGSALSYDIGTSKAAVGFDANHIEFTEFNTKIPAVTYLGTGQMKVRINQLTGQERCGLTITSANGDINMDSISLNIPQFQLTTPTSSLQLTMSMDTQTPPAPSAGDLEATVTGQVGKSDLVPFVIASIPEFQQTWPNESMRLDLHAYGHQRTIHVNRADLILPNHLTMKSTAHIVLPDTITENMALDLMADTRLHNIDFVKGLLPADVRNSFNIPHNMTAKTKLKMANDNVSVKAEVGIVEKSSIRLDADYGMRHDTYDADIEVKNFDVGMFVPLEKNIGLSGHITAKGQGLDVFSPATKAMADLQLQQAYYGDIDISDAKASLKLEKGMLAADVSCDNSLVQTHFLLDGKMQTKAIDATLDIQLPHADLYALGLADDIMSVSTVGTMDIHSNLKDIHRIDADIQSFNLTMGENTISAEAFKVFAESTRDTTNATLSTGDLYFDFHAPDNIMKILEQGEKLASMASSQFESRSLDLDELKSYMPVTTLQVKAGMNNPLSQYLAINKVRFQDLEANLHSGPDIGLVGHGHIYNIVTDSLSIDSLSLDLEQDADRMIYNTSLICSQQKHLPAFSAYVDGYVSPSEVDAHLSYYNNLHRQGLDLGVRAYIADSMLHASLYPREPILAFKRFALNDDNYIRLAKKNRMFANVQLKSLNDSSSITITANPDVSLRQDIRAIVHQLDLEEILEYIPGMPKMQGKLNVDANYMQDYEKFWVRGMSSVKDYVYDGTGVGNIKAVFDYNPVGDSIHDVKATLSHNDLEVGFIDGTYNGAGKGNLKANVRLNQLPLSMAAPFIPDQIVTLEGTMGGNLKVQGPTDALTFNGQLLPNGMKVNSDVYSLRLRFADEPFEINNSRISFNQYKIYGTGEDPLTLNGWVDFAQMNNVKMALALYGKNFLLIDAPRTRKSLVFGKMYGDFYARVTGDTHDMRVRGVVKVLSKTDMTYIMADTPLSMDYRLDDIVTFVDFSAPPEIDENREKRTFLGMDMELTLTVEDGAEFHCEFSADRQSYVNVQGGGSIIVNQTPEGVFSMIGRYTVNEGEMKYALPIIPLKTFMIESGSYVEFTGEASNPTINVAANEETRATVSDAGGSSRSVTFLAGLNVTGTLEKMQLEFTIDAPEDISVKNELASMSKEEKNKLAVGLLCTGMYLSSSNSSGFNANNALNNFLQNEINNIAGQALATTVDVNVGMEQSTRDDGTTRTDYSFKFSKRFFSNRLNVVIGGKVNADGNTQENESGAYIDNVSLEYRLDDGGTRYVRLYHEKNYDNLVEGELIENGASVVLRKKFDHLSDLIIWRKKKEEKE